jgi:hypothetical protein
MPRGPKGEKRPADVIGGVGIMVGRDYLPFAFSPSSRLITSASSRKTRSA